MINKVILLGRLGGDPESKVTPNTIITKFTVATNEFKTVKGKKKEVTEWHDVTVFGRNAENSAKYLKKGDQVYLEGRIETNKWVAQDGTAKSKKVIVAEQVKFLSKSSNKWQGDQDDTDPNDYADTGDVRDE